MAVCPAGGKWTASVLDPPSGAFTQVAMGYSRACGLRPTGEVECWGADMPEDTPPGPFTHIDMAGRFACGVRPDSTLECWGKRARWFSNNEPKGMGFQRIKCRVRSGLRAPGKWRSTVLGHRSQLLGRGQHGSAGCRDDSSRGR